MRSAGLCSDGEYLRSSLPCHAHQHDDSYYFSDASSIDSDGLRRKFWSVGEPSKSAILSICHPTRAQSLNSTEAGHWLLSSSTSSLATYLNYY